MLREDGDIELIDNAHTILRPHADIRFGPNSIFLPGSNFYARNLLGFPFLHCCSGTRVCPEPKPAECPGRSIASSAAGHNFCTTPDASAHLAAIITVLLACCRHTLYWPALLLDYRCHVPRGRLGDNFEPKTRSCLAELSSTSASNLSAAFRLPTDSGTRMLERLSERARLLLSLGMEGAWLAVDHSHGYYLEALALVSSLATPCIPPVSPQVV